MEFEDELPLRPFASTIVNPDVEAANLVGSQGYELGVGDGDDTSRGTG